MKRLLIALLFALLVGLVSTTYADSVIFCRDTSVAWARFHFSYGGQIDGWSWLGIGESGDITNLTLDALADGTAQVSILLPGASRYTVYNGSPTTPVCGKVLNDAPSIAIQLTSDCAYVEIHNPDGGWSRVADKDHPDGILLHYGEALIGSRGQDVNNADYRAVPTACY